MPLATPSPELALADEHDAAGRHHEAIDALARGTSAGNLACMRQLGKRLLTGDRAPLLAAEGARFLLDAANRGDPEAAARIAALTALGLYLKPNLRDALRWLALAAERGWSPAQGQLHALAGVTASTENPTSDYWSRLAARIDLAPGGQSARSRAEPDPLIQALDSFISPPVCDWLIARARGRLTRALVYDPVNQQDIASQTRTNSVANFGLTDVELLDVLLQAQDVLRLQHTDEPHGGSRRS